MICTVWGLKLYLAKILSTGNFIDGRPIKSGITYFGTTDVRYGQDSTTTAKGCTVPIDINVLHIPAIIIGRGTSSSIVRIIGASVGGLAVYNIIGYKSDITSQFIFITNVKTIFYL